MGKNYFCWHKNTLHIELQIQTKASKNSVIGIQTSRLKISINALPEKGKANTQLVKFLAQYFGVPIKQVTLTKGLTNKYKSAAIIDPKKNLELFTQGKTNYLGCCHVVG